MALAGLVAFVSALASRQLFNDGDTYWHLAAGDWILAHRAVPEVDTFSYTFVGRPWHAHEWLTEILMALAFRAAGWNGLSLMFGAAFALLTVALGRFLTRWLAIGPWAVTLVLTLACVLPSLLARPHLLALPLLAIWLGELLEARRAGRTPGLWLLPLMLLWANLHGSFVVGLGLAGAFGLEALIEARTRPWPVIRGWGLFGVLALGLGLATPHGISGLIFPVTISSMTSLPLIAEWRSPNFVRIGVLEVAILEALFICLWRGVKVPPLRLLILLGFFHLTLQHVRHQSVFVVVAAILLAEPIARAALTGLRPEPSPSKPFPAVAVLGAVVLALAAGAWRLATPSIRTDSLSAPISALAAVPPELARRPVFNAYGFGGYLIFKGVRPFIDGRGDMYGDPFMQLYGAMTRPKLSVLRRELDARHIDWTILTAGEPAVGALDAMPEWRRLYSDTYAVVHVRRAVGTDLNLPEDDGEQVPPRRSRTAPPGPRG